jgi:hypothetical protein
MSARPDRWADRPGLEQRDRIAQAVWHHLLADADVVSLPLEVRIDSEERAIAVDGVDQSCSGVRIAGRTSRDRCQSVPTRSGKGVSTGTL